MHKQKSCSGFNLIETAIVLGVVGLIIGGIWVAAAAVSENRKQTRALEQIIYYTDRIKNVFYGHTSTAGSYFVLWDVAGGINIRRSAWDTYLPPDMYSTVSGNRPTSPWGGIVNIFIYPAERYVSVSYENIPRGSCIKLGPKIYALARTQLRLNPDGYYVNTTLGGDISTPDLAGAGCNSATSNTIYLEYNY